MLQAWGLEKKKAAQLAPRGPANAEFSQGQADRHPVYGRTGCKAGRGRLSAPDFVR